MVYYKKRSYSQTSSSQKSAPVKRKRAISITDIKKYVEQEMDRTTEKKYYDVNQSNISISNSGFVLHVTNVATQGDDNVGERVGDRITSKSISCKAYIEGNAANTTEYINLALILDKHPNGTAPTLANIFENGADVNSPINWTNKERFVVLRRFRIPMSPNLTRINEMPEFYISFDKDKRLSKHKNCTFDSANGARENHVYWVGCSDKAANMPVIYSRFRYVYTDK